MIPFHSQFPTVALGEMRQISTDAHPLLPDCDWGFIEFFCNETGCDCRRVVVRVVRSGEATPAATINSGWESVAYYRKWFGRQDALVVRMAGATLEPSGPQSPRSSALLALFRQAVAADPTWVQDFKRHYGLVRSFQAGTTRRDAGFG